MMISLRRIVHILMFSHHYLPLAVGDFTTLEQCECGSIGIWEN
jgi:hypothetical protein